MVTLNGTVWGDGFSVALSGESVRSQNSEFLLFSFFTIFTKFAIMGESVGALG